MPRLPYAARTFTEQVRELRKSAKFDAGDVDGLDVYRSITFDKATSKWLGHALDYIDDDRIVGYGTGTKDQLTVVFSHRAYADNKDPFPLAEAIEVSSAEAR